MTNLRLMPLLFAMATLFADSGARAAVPSAAESTTPATIRLVGSTSGVPDTTMGRFLVVVRDLARNPKNGASVVVDFSSCPDVAICSDQLDPAEQVNCALKTVRSFTNIQGAVTFTILGVSNGAGHAASVANCARIIANGTPLRSPSVAVFDLDGVGGVGAGDLSVWLDDFGSGIPYGRSDFDGNGSIGSNDLSLWLTKFGAGTSFQSCGATCP